MKPQVFGMLSLAVIAAFTSGSARAQSDQPAAVLMFPRIDVDSRRGVDTHIEIVNSSNYPIGLHCVYQESGEICRPVAFTVELAAQMPFAWNAGEGRREFGTYTSHPGLIPPVASDPYAGTLQCTAVDRNRVPVQRNDLIGQATIERRQRSQAIFDATTYGATMLRATGENLDPDGALVFGGPQGDYEACAGALIVPHFFDGAIDPVTKASKVTTSLSIIPCGPSAALESVDGLVLSYEIFNEFEQRLMVVAPVRGCMQPGQLSLIDTDDANRSSFSIGVAGTLTGQTIVSARDGSTGLVGLTVAEYRSRANPNQSHLAAANPSFLRRQGVADTLTLAGIEVRPCVGDCGLDRTVTVDEILTGITIALGETSADACNHTATPFDPDANGEVTVDELLTAIDRALNGCH